MLDKFKEKYKHVLRIEQIYILYKMVPIVIFLTGILMFAKNEIVIEYALLAIPLTSFMVLINVFFAWVSYKNKVYQYNINAKYTLLNYFTWKYMSYFLGIISLLIMLSAAISTDIQIIKEFIHPINDEKLSWTYIVLMTVITIGILKYISVLINTAIKEYKMLKPDISVIDEFLNHSLIKNASKNDVISLLYPNYSTTVGFILNDFVFLESEVQFLKQMNGKRNDIIDTCYYKDKLISLEAILKYVTENGLFLDEVDQDEMLVFDMYEYS